MPNEHCERINSEKRQMLQLILGNSYVVREFIQSNTQFYLKNSLGIVPSFNTKYWILSENSISMVHNAFRQELKKSLKLTFWQLLRLENQTIQISAYHNFNDVAINFSRDVFLGLNEKRNTYFSENYSFSCFSLHLLRPFFCQDFN